METPAHNQLTDTELLDKYRQTGNKDFMGILYKRYSHLVFGLCMKYFKDQDQAYDASVNIFTKLFFLLFPSLYIYFPKSMQRVS